MEIILVILKMASEFPLATSFTRGAQEMEAARRSHGDVYVQMLLPFISEQLLRLYLPIHACMHFHFRVPIRIPVTLSELSELAVCHTQQGLKIQ